MRSYRHADFRRGLARLPTHVRTEARRAYRLLRADPFHPGLGFKEVRGSRGLWSIRVGLRYRALGRRDGDEIVWFWIGSYADYDDLIGR